MAQRRRGPILVLVVGACCAFSVSQNVYELPALLQYLFGLVSIGCMAFNTAVSQPVMKRYRADRKTPPPLPVEKGFVSNRVLLFVAVLAFFGMLFSFAFAGCAGAKVPTYVALQGMVEAAKGARDVLPATCEAAQDIAIKNAPTAAAAEEARAANMARCRATKTGLDAAVEACAAAGKEIREIKNLADLPEAIGRWAIAAKNLYDASMKMKLELERTAKGGAQ